MCWIKPRTAAPVKMATDGTLVTGGRTVRRYRIPRWARMDSSRTTARDIRRRNRSALLSTLFFDGPLSRLELSQVTGLSGATVSNVTAELVEERLVVEAG